MSEINFSTVEEWDKKYRLFLGAQGALPIAFSYRINKSPYRDLLVKLFDGAIIDRVRKIEDNLNKCASDYFSIFLKEEEESFVFIWVKNTRNRISLDKISSLIMGSYAPCIIKRKERNDIDRNTKTFRLSNNKLL